MWNSSLLKASTTPVEGILPSSWLLMMRTMGVAAVGDRELQIGKQNAPRSWSVCAVDDTP